jgi:hypothetical protein
VLKGKYAPELVGKLVAEAPDGDEAPDEDEAPAPALVESGDDAPRKETAEESIVKVLNQILDAVKELSVRVGRLEATGAVRPGVDAHTGGVE